MELKEILRAVSKGEIPAEAAEKLLRSLDEETSGGQTTVDLSQSEWSPDLSSGNVSSQTYSDSVTILGGNCDLKIRGEADQLTAKTGEGESISIERNNGSSTIDLSSQETDEIEITVPSGISIHVTSSFDIDIRKFSGKATIKSFCGDIHVYRTQGELDVSTTAGDVRIDESHGKLTADIGAGDLTCRDFHGEITAKSLAGNLTAENCSYELRFKSLSGDARVRDFSGVIKIDSRSGDIELDEFSGSGELKSTSGDIGIAQTTSKVCQLECKATSGDITVSFPEGSGIRAETKVVSGEVKADSVYTYDPEGTTTPLRGRSKTYVMGDSSSYVNLSAMSGDISLRATK